MNSIWNSNISRFTGRFPALADMFGISTGTDDLPPALRAPIEIVPSKQGVPTAREGGKFLHSAYNPLREAEQAARAAHGTGHAAFFGCALGYAAVSYAAQFPADTLVIVEPDARYFFTALATVDWSPVFAAQNCVLAIATGADIVVSLMERSAPLGSFSIVANPAHTAHAAAYFSALADQLRRNKQKDSINSATLARFSALWRANTVRNLPQLAVRAGVNRYARCCPAGLPFVVLAAGPTLADVLPHLAQLKKRAVLVAVDTALRACLAAGVEPDFIVLGDPQFYAYTHIAGLSAPSSVLITETLAYPPVFRFPCKEIILFSSTYPLSRYFESRLGEKGELTSGGSVSTTAWDFARLSGASEIFCAGLDLGFPALQTHIRGSTFEEKIHAASRRTAPAESAGTTALFGANMTTETDYAGAPILTDNRMKLFAWWFESKATENPGIASYSFSPHSLAIPGFSTASITDFLRRPEKPAERAEFLCAGAPHAETKLHDEFPTEHVKTEPHAHLVSNSAHAETAANKELTTELAGTLTGADAAARFEAVHTELLVRLAFIAAEAKCALRLCDDGMANALKRQKNRAELAALEAALHERADDELALVLPPRPADVYAAATLSEDPVIADFQKKRLLYKTVLAAATELETVL